MKNANYGMPYAWTALNTRWMVILLLLAVALPCYAQRTTYRITFRDKGPQAFAPGEVLYEATLRTFHPDALERRRRLGKEPLLDSLDQPLAESYLQTLTDRGIKPLVVMPWRNAVLVDLDTLEASIIAALPMVARVVPTSSTDYRPVSAQTSADCWPADPGPSRSPHRLLNTLPLLDAGVTGVGATVCVIDNGFRPQGMSSLQHLDVRGTYDVIQGDSTVWNQDGDPGNQDGHGSLVLSIAAGWQQGELIGCAPFATYLLAKTEDMRFERRIEEDLYAAAVEWAERHGAGVMTSSLGYFDFDSTEQKLDYDVLDGRTTFAAQALNRAAALGVVCVTAAGNSGPRERTIGIPADADSVIAVGGTMPDGSVYLPTSQGPTADGRAKPDLAAMAGGVRSQSLDGSYISATGTSMAAPQIAGVVALLRQLYPDVPSWALRSALYASATIPDSAGMRLGVGVPDAFRAAKMMGEQHGAGIGPPVIVDAAGIRRVLFTVFSETFAPSTLQIKGVDGTLRGDVYTDLWHGVDVALPFGVTDTLWGRLWTEHRGVMRAFPTDSTWFAIPRIGSVIPCGVRIPDRITSVDDRVVAAAPFPKDGVPAARIVPTPTSADQRWVDLIGVREIRTIQLVQTSTGAVLDGLTWTRRVDGRIALHLPPLSPGHYQVVVTTTSTITSAPLIIF